MGAEVVTEAIDKTTVLSQILADHPYYFLLLILLGFMGGTISGFIGSGGAFLMTPGMMNLGIPGIMAVGANITHKFGKAMMGQKKHAELGHVDRRLGLILLITALAGIRTAVVINNYFFERLGKDGSSLYVSVFFVISLSLIGFFILRDARRNLIRGMSRSSDRLVRLLKRFQFRPFLYFKVANVHVSVALVVFIGFWIGFMAGTIGVGGFIGVPAMIYLFGAPTVVATGTELFLAMFMGAFGALNYGFGGYVDLRITLLLFAGSLIGLFLGAIGTSLVKEVYIRLVTGILILLCAVSRGLAVPSYLDSLNWVDLSENTVSLLKVGSAVMLFGSGALATSLILYFVFRAHFREQLLFRRYRASVTGMRREPVPARPGQS